MRARAISMILLLVLTLSMANVLALPKKGEKAPNFMVPTYEGETISLSRLEGKIVVLMFAAEWCPHCGEEIPAIASTWKEMGLEVDNVIGVLMMVSSNKNKAVNFFKRANPPSNWKLVVDANTVAEKYGVTGVPTTIVLDKDGTVAEEVVGAAPPTKILSVVAKLAGIEAQPQGNYTQPSTTPQSTNTLTQTSSTPPEEGGLSLGAMILIALAVALLVGFGLWYYKTMRKFKSTKKKKKNRKKKKSK